MICEVRGHYWSNRSTELTWCYNCNTPPVLATPASGTPNSAINISLIGLAAFARASRLADVQVFKLFVSTMDPRDLDTTPVDMSNVPLEYHKFRDVFTNPVPTPYCEGDAADEATIIDYSKTGANKR